MNQYKEIDDLVETYKNGQEYPKNSPERENAKVAEEMLVMTFKPLVLSVMSKFQVPDEQFEDGFQDGLLAFMKGLDRFDPEHGAAFNAFIRVHLCQYYRKWKRGQFDHSVKADKAFDDKIPRGEGLTLEEVVPDRCVNLEANYIEREEKGALQKKLARGLSRLMPAQKRVIEAYYYEGVNQDTIAEREGISQQAVSARHDRALKKLKKVL